MHDKSESLKQQIEEFVDRVDQFVIIHEPLAKTIFSLLIDITKSNTYSFLSAVNKAVEAYKVKGNHPLASEELQAASWQELADLNRLFYCDKSIHEIYAINSDYKAFIQWIFYKHLSQEYGTEIPKTINLNKQPQIVSHQKIAPISYQHIIPNDEMANLIFMLQDPDITADDKKEIGKRIRKANSAHNTNINIIEKNKLFSPNVNFFKPNISTSYGEEKILLHYRCISDGLVEERDGCLYVRGASKITAINNSNDELKIDNKEHSTLEMHAGFIMGLVDNAVVIYNDEKLKPINGMVTVMGFGIHQPNNTNSFRS